MMCSVIPARVRIDRQSVPAVKIAMAAMKVCTGVSPVVFLFGYLDVRANDNSAKPGNYVLPRWVIVRMPAT